MEVEMLRKLSFIIGVLAVLIAFTACPQNGPSGILPPPVWGDQGGDEPAPEPLPDPETPGVYYVDSAALFTEALEEAASDGIASTIVISGSFAIDGTILTDVSDLTIRAESDSVLTLNSVVDFLRPNNVVIDGVHINSSNGTAITVNNQGAANITIRNSYFTNTNAADVNAIGIALADPTSGTITITGNYFDGYVTGLYVNKTTAALTVTGNTFVDKGGLYLDWKLTADDTVADNIIIEGNKEDYSSAEFAMDNTIRFSVNSVSDWNETLKSYAAELAGKNTVDVRAIADGAPLYQVYPTLQVEVASAEQFADAMKIEHTGNLEIVITESFDLPAARVESVKDVTITALDDVVVNSEGQLYLWGAENVAFKNVDFTSAKDVKVIGVEASSNVSFTSCMFEALERDVNEIAIAISPTNGTGFTVEDCDFTNYVTGVFAQAPTKITGNDFFEYGGISIGLPNAISDDPASLKAYGVSGNTSEYTTEWNPEAEDDSRFDNTLRFSVSATTEDALADAVKTYAGDLAADNPGMNVVVINDQWHDSPVLWSQAATE